MKLRPFPIACVPGASCRASGACSLRYASLTAAATPSPASSRRRGPTPASCAWCAFLSARSNSSICLPRACSLSQKGITIVQASATILCRPLGSDHDFCIKGAMLPWTHPELCGNPAQKLTKAALTSSCRQAAANTRICTAKRRNGN